MKIGVFGGSFNPPHKMHKEIVMQLIKKGYVDKVIVIPTADNYAKPYLLNGIDRVNMLKEIFKKEKKVEVSDYEVQGHLYTINTLNYYQKKYPKDKLYFILGTDLLATFDTWKEYEKILNNYRLLVVARDTNEYEVELQKYLKYKNHIELAKIRPRIISSTEVRNEILKHGYTEKLKDYLYVSTIKYLKTIDIKKHWK